MLLKSGTPVLHNTRPWNELILRGVRTFKTIAFSWKYRGTIYLYDTRGKSDDYGFEWAEDEGVKSSTLGIGHPGHIVGTVQILGVRGNSDCAESDAFEILFRNPKRMRPVPYTPRKGTIRISRVP